MEIQIALNKELHKKISKLVDKSDFYELEKILKEKGDNASRNHIKNVVEKCFTTTRQRMDVIIEYYKVKLEAINQQKQIAKKWEN